MNELDEIFVDQPKKGDRIREIVRGFKFSLFGWTFSFEFYKEKIVTKTILDPVEPCQASEIANYICITEEQREQWRKEYMDGCNAKQEKDRADHQERMDSHGH